MVKDDILNKLKEVQQKANEIIETSVTLGDRRNGSENKKFDFTNTDNLDETHRDYISQAKKVKKWFEDKDEVEVEESLIDENFRENAWKNINIYTFDVLDNFFLKTCILNLTINNKLFYKMYFSIEGENIFLYVEDYLGNSVVGGTVCIQDAKFIPISTITDDYFKIFLNNHIEEGLPRDRQTVANRALMNCLLYFLLVNELFHRSKEVITETSRRIDIKPKNTGKKKKKQPKKTKLIRYIKIDGAKVKRIREEQERAERESYERHTSEWTRVGHYRTLRNGERKWINPTTCHAQTKTGEKIPKLYKLK